MKNTAVMSSPVGSWGELRFQMPGKTRVSKDYIKILLLQYFGRTTLH